MPKITDKILNYLLDNDGKVSSEHTAYRTVPALLAERAPSLSMHNRGSIATAIERLEADGMVKVKQDTAPSGRTYVRTVTLAKTPEPKPTPTKAVAKRIPKDRRPDSLIPIDVTPTNLPFTLGDQVTIVGLLLGEGDQVQVTILTESGQRVRLTT